MAYDYDCGDECGGLSLAVFQGLSPATRDFYLFCVMNQVLTAVEEEGGGGEIQTPATTTVAANGSTTADAYVTVSFGAPLANSTNPTVQGAALTPGHVVTFSANPGSSLAAIAYTASATANLVIRTITK